jgi:hypothetical protein
MKPEYQADTAYWKEQHRVANARAEVLESLLREAREYVNAYYLPPIKHRRQRDLHHHLLNRIDTNIKAAQRAAGE